MLIFKSFRGVMWVAALCLIMGRGVGAGEVVAPKPEELFPDTTIVAVALPDLDAARKAAAGSRLGEIFKQPDMQAFLNPILERIAASYSECRVAEPRLPAGDALSAVLFAGEIGVCVFAKEIGAEPGIIVSFKPKNPKAFEAMLAPLFKGQPIPAEQPVPMGIGENPPGLLYSNGRVLFCKAISDLESVSARISDPQKRAAGTLASTAGYKSARAVVGDAHAWAYLNPAAILPLAGVLAGNVVPDPRELFKAIGVDKVTGILVGLDFANGEPVSQFYWGLGGPPTGLYTLMGTKPVRKDVLQIAAEDAPYVAAGSFNFHLLVPAIRDLAKAAGPEPLKIFTDGLARISEMLQFNLEKDLLENIEPDMASAQTRLETGAALSLSPGIAGVMRVKNGPKVDECLKKIVALAGAMLPQMQMPEFMARIATTPYNGTTLYYLSQPINGSICAAVVKNNLVWGNSVNAVKRGIDQMTSGSNILSNKTFQTTIARVSGKPFDAENLPASLAYSVDNGSGSGILFLTALGLGTEAAVVSGISQALPRNGQPRAADFNLPPYMQQLSANPGARTALNVLNGVDLNLWPDEAFFARYRLAHGSAAFWNKGAFQGRSELPPPMPSSNFNAMPVVAVAAIVSAIAIPNLLRSRMAANETAALAACKAYCTAQDIYRRTDYNRDGVLEYAQRLGGDNSLYENKAGAGDISLIDRSFAAAEGGPGKATPKAGYYFKVLTQQGANAPGGARSYIANGRLTLGYALLAYPAQYDNTARNTFLVNNSGTIYQKDMGAETPAIVEKMTEYNPDNTWVVAE